jgi:hypothetical protein
MYVPNPIVKTGFFFSPEAPNKTYPGILTVSNGGRAMLEITAAYTPFVNSGEAGMDRLIGKVEGGFVTLENCTYRRMSLPFGGLPDKTIIAAKTVYDGAGFQEPPLLTSLNFCVDGLSEWLGRSAFKVHHREKFEDTTIEITRPQEITCSLPDGTEFEINVEIRLPGRARYPVTELFQQAYITLRPAEAKTIDFYQGLTHQITRFFSFAIGKTVALHSLTAQYEETGRSDFHSQVDVYFQSLHGTEKSVFDTSEMLLGYKRLAPRFGEMLGLWLSEYENLMPALHHHYAVQDGNHGYADTKFLAIAQAIEAFHRRTTLSSKWPEDEYKAKVNTILAACPAHERDWLRSKLAHGNEISLADRLHQLIDRFDSVFGGERVIHSVVRGTVNTRNYHAHYDRHGQAKALTGGALVGLTYRLRVLFTLSLLVHLGFSEKEAIEVAGFDYLKKMLLTAAHLDAQSRLETQ